MPSSTRPKAESMPKICLQGGKSALHTVPRPSISWIVRQGLSSVSIDTVVRLTGISQGNMARILGVPKRTLLRRERAGNLSPDESARLVRFARIVERAELVFESTDAAHSWLQAPNRSLGGVRPLSLLDTDVGGDNVLDTLGRIEHGLFA